MTMDSNRSGTILYVKLDGVMPSVDQFTVHVAPDREPCSNHGTGGTCVAGVAGFIDGDELTHSNWHKSSSTAGTLLFSITTTVRVSKIEIKYHRPQYEPGWLIKENGVEVYRESTNGGSDSEPSPVTYTYDLTTKFALVDISSTISTDFKFSGAATASNGKIIFAPLNADGVGVFDPTDNSFTLVDISSTISTGQVNSNGAATALATARSSLRPLDADGVGVFDPTDNSFALVDISSTISTDEKFIGAATASNGKIIFAPCKCGRRGSV